MTPFRGLRSRLSYANVTASLALFIALGGTGYAAVTLPRNSVGSAQLRNNAVGAKEIRRGAVAPARSATARSASATSPPSTRTSLRGTPGPTGPAGKDAATYRAAINLVGGIAGGNARGGGHQLGSNLYRVEFPADVSACMYTRDARRGPERPGARAAAGGAHHRAVGRRQQRPGAHLQRRRRCRRGAVSSDRRLLNTGALTGATGSRERPSRNSFARGGRSAG